MIEELVESLKRDKKIKKNFILTTVTLKLEKNKIFINHGWSIIGLLFIVLIFLIFFVLGSLLLNESLSIYFFIGLLLVLALFGFNAAKNIDGSGYYISSLKKSRGDIFASGLILDY